MNLEQISINKTQLKPSQRQKWKGVIQTKGYGQQLSVPRSQRSTRKKRNNRPKTTVTEMNSVLDRNEIMAKWPQKNGVVVIGKDIKVEYYIDKLS